MTLILTIPNIHPSTSNHNHNHNPSFYFPLTHTDSSPTTNFFALSKRTDYFQLIDKLTEFNLQNPTTTQKVYESNFLEVKREIEVKKGCSEKELLFDEI
jgi:hypothetical protein